MNGADAPQTRIVLVDDQALVRAGLRMLVESGRGFAVVGEAGDRDEALAVIAREQPDIILLELSIGGRNSLEFFTELTAAAEGDVVLPERVSSVTLPILFPPLKVKELVGDTRLLSAFRIGDEAVLEAFADELSAGQQQKLALSLALSQEADFYVLDEPLANLDQESRATAMDIILERTEGKTLVLIMHGSEEYHTLFDRIIKLDAVSGNGSRRPEHTSAV